MRWFKHLTSARNDEALSEMVELFGAESYGVWWIMLELIGAQMDKTNKCSARYSVRKWAKSCKVSMKKFQKIANFLSEFEKISIEICEKNKDFWIIECSNLLKFRDEYSKKSGQTPDNIPTVSGETPDQDTEAEAELEVELEKERTLRLFETAFEKWWIKTPERNGKRIGKKDAKKEFFKTKQKDWGSLNTATENYCVYVKNGTSARDPVRFLKNGYWKEHIKPGDLSNKKGSANEMPADIQ